MFTVYKEKSDCSGCGVCQEACSRKAISMITDSEGFLYPYIDESKCIDCGVCHKICPNRTLIDDYTAQKYYAAKVNDESIRDRSRSGGIFFTVGKHILSIGGCVYGAILDKKGVHHVCAENDQTLCLMQGSKYVESDISGIFADVYMNLCDDRFVLFSGTPCQVAALKQFLKIKRTVNMKLLYTIDIICHGVPSKMLFNDYMDHLNSKFGGGIQNFNFRDKSFGWDTSVESFYVDDKKHISNNYTSMFYSNLALRPSCGQCKFSNYNRPGDITLGDFWGLKEHMPHFDDNKGVSAVIVNNSHGAEMLGWISKDITIAEVDQSVCTQPRLHSHLVVNENERKAFWNIYSKRGYKSILRKYGRGDILHRIKWNFVDKRELYKCLDAEE